MTNNKKSILQSLCRLYLERLQSLAEQIGLHEWLNTTIEDNKNGKCVSTEEQVEMLARMCDEERLTREDVPKVLEKSYRKAYEDGDFEKIKTLKRVGIYSKISTLLLKSQKL